MTFSVIISFLVLSGSLLSCICDKTLDVTGSLVDPDKLYDNASPKHNIELSLNNGDFSTLTRSDGSFSFYNVPSGIYLLEVMSTKHAYSNFKLKVVAENNTITVLEYKFPGASKLVVPHPILIRPHTRMSYFNKRTPFSIIGMIMGNPMMVMMAVSGIIVIFFPQMLQGGDKEQMKELQDQMSENMGDPMQAWKKALGMETTEED